MIRRTMVIGLLVVVLAGMTAALPARAQIESICFPETGQCISGQIRLFWQQNGGLPIFGYPIAPAQTLTIDGKPILAQPFERFRIEIHPENAPPYNVLLGRMGAERLAQQGIDPQIAFPRGAPQPGCRYFAETGHNVCGALLNYWQRNGLRYFAAPGVTPAESLGLWGLPLSDLTTETLSDGRSYQVQWFERARLELHPENAAPYNILGGLLGSEIAANQAAAQPATPQPATTAPAAAPAACNRLPSRSRTASRQGISFDLDNWEYRDRIGGADAGDGFRYLTFDIMVFNSNYRPDGVAPKRIFVDLQDLILIDREGRSLTPDTVTSLMGDRFVSGQVRVDEGRGGRLVYQLPLDFIPLKLIYRSPDYPRVEIDLNWPCP